MWQTVRRITNEILGVKGSKKQIHRGCLSERGHLLAGVHSVLVTEPS